MLKRKSALFSVTACVVVAVLAIPVIIPHLLHGYHMFHIGLHIGGLTMGIFVTLLAVAAYGRARTHRLAISSLAFGCFVVSETINLVSATWPYLGLMDLSLVEVAHVANFAALGLLAMAVFKND